MANIILITIVKINITILNLSALQNIIHHAYIFVISLEKLKQIIHYLLKRCSSRDKKYGNKTP